MKYLGDPKGYTRKELIIARKIRAMEESSDKEKCIRDFLKKTGKMFPVYEPGIFCENSEVASIDRRSPYYNEMINELCRNPHKYTFGKLS